MKVVGAVREPPLRVRIAVKYTPHLLKRLTVVVKRLSACLEGREVRFEGGETTL